jgi:hypothetical protein
MNIFFLDRTQYRVGVFFDVHRYETTSSEAHFQLREEPEVTWCEVWGLGRVWHNRNVVFRYSRQVLERIPPEYRGNTVLNNYRVSNT